jgi:hypothetical protein
VRRSSKKDGDQGRQQLSEKIHTPALILSFRIEILTLFLGAFPKYRGLKLTQSLKSIKKEGEMTMSISFPQ